MNSPISRSIFSLPLRAAAAALILLFPQCGKVPVSNESNIEKITVGPGPEDMVLDSLHGESRLLISCCSRRENEEPYGEIVACENGSGKQTILVRAGEPPDLLFRPHGIYLEADKLYVISHEKEPDDHPVLIYTVRRDSLLLEEVIRSPLLHSPNALATGPDGAIFVVNDSGKRGSILEKALKLKRAGVVRLEKDPEGTWSATRVAGKLGYPAGINRIGNQLYVGDAVLHRIHVYTISGNQLIPGAEIQHVRGNDNIRIYRNQLLTPGHVKPFKFIGHARDPRKQSPVEVFLIDPQDGQITSLFYSDGSVISAGSTAIILDHSLFICQVFEPFLLKVSL
jgi:hypothetical protein